MAKFTDSTERRQARVRRAVKAGANGRPRLSVFRSSKHIYAQVIDDRKGGTVAAASSLEKTMRDGRQDRRQRRRRQGGRQAGRRARGRARASPRWCSTAAAISTTAASRRSPMPRAKAD